MKTYPIVGGAVLVLAMVGQTAAFMQTPTITASRAPLMLRGNRAPAATMISMIGESRRSFLQLAATASVPMVCGLAVPAHAAEGPAKVVELPLQVLKQIAGASDAEYAEFKTAPSKPLQAVEADIYRAYKYAAEKCPATEDPRASLRGLYGSKVADLTFKYAQETGATPKIYDARGDGLTNQGKGGVLKGLKVLMEGLKKQGLLQDFSVDSSTHSENNWLQGNPTSVTVSVTQPVGLAAAKLLQEEKTGLVLSVSQAAIQGYLKQCKLVSSYEQVFSDNGETLKVDIKWAGKERQKNTLDRRAADRLNAARAYKE